jgi:hypothetical protein
MMGAARAEIQSACKMRLPSSSTMGVPGGDSSPSGWSSDTAFCEGWLKVGEEQDSAMTSRVRSRRRRFHSYQVEGPPHPSRSWSPTCRPCRPRPLGSVWPAWHCKEGMARDDGGLESDLVDGRRHGK